MAGYRGSQIRSLVADLTTDPLTEIAERIYDLEIERDEALEKIDEMKREINKLELENEQLEERLATDA